MAKCSILLTVMCFENLIFRLFTKFTLSSKYRFFAPVGHSEWHKRRVQSLPALSVGQACTVILRSPSLVILKEPPLLDFAPPKGAYFWLQSLLSVACRHGARKQCGRLKNLVKDNLNEGSLCSLRACPESNEGINSVTKNLLLEKPVRNHIYEYIY